MSRIRDLRHIQQLVFGQAHLIEPEAGDLIAQVVLHAREMSADELQAEADARLGPDRGIQRRDPVMYPNGVLIVPVHGELAQRHTNMAADSGIANYERLSRIASAADTDDSVRHIVLHISSPGGLHAGLIECMTVWQRLKTPVTAYCDSLMASAAYGLGACAGEMVLSPGGVRVGSIGSIMIVPDISGRLEKEGVKVRIFRSGSLKAPTQFESLNAEQAASIQRKIDEAASSLMDAICEVRTGCTVQALSDLDGDLFTGEEALDRKLADRVELWEDFISDLVGLPYGDGSWDNMRDYEPPTQPTPPSMEPEETDMDARAMAVAMGLPEADITAHEEAGDLETWVQEQAVSTRTNSAEQAMRLRTLEDQAAQTQAREVETFVAQAVKDKKIRDTDEAKADLRALATADLDRAKSLVAGLSSFLPPESETDPPTLPNPPTSPAPSAPSTGAITSLDAMAAVTVGEPERQVMEMLGISEEQYQTSARQREVSIRAVEAADSFDGRTPKWSALQDLPQMTEAELTQRMFGA